LTDTFIKGGLASNIKILDFINTLSKCKVIRGQTKARNICMLTRLEVTMAMTINTIVYRYVKPRSLVEIK